MKNRKRDRPTEIRRSRIMYEVIHRCTGRLTNKQLQKQRDTQKHTHTSRYIDRPTEIIEAP